MPALYRVTEQQVLASAGLDAYVFLSFFKMSIRLFGTLFLFAAAILEPINRHFLAKHADDQTRAFFASRWYNPQATLMYGGQVVGWTHPEEDAPSDDEPDSSFDRDMGYLWAYLIFTYFFTILTMIFVNKETLKLLRIRQDYLGTQSTITDRTFELSGIPKDLRTEESIKTLIESLEIGQVESVTLCRDWKKIDGLMQERDVLLRKLEETWSFYLGQKPLTTGVSGPEDMDARQNYADEPADEEEAGESGRLITGPSTNHIVERQRPQTRIWYGFLGLQSRHTDALDYYEENLRQLDEKIRIARKQKYEAANLAFVTMDSIAACQMAIQALIDPRPDLLQTKPAPAPSDVIWGNTYTPYLKREAQFWIITIFVAILSIIWLIPVGSLASLLSFCTLRKVFPGIVPTLTRHSVLKALVQTGIPTAVVSLLNIAVPYLYDYLSYYQGMVSRSDVALSVISKVFFFTFFNIFLVFTVFGTATSIIIVIREGLKDTTSITFALARQIQNWSVFYLNFIMLQGIGLFPFRLLEFGSVAMYPILRMGAKTPRDFAEMDAPPPFNFAFYLPTALLIFILCLIYSVMPGGFLVLLLGIIYFVLGYFTYKYQLLYAMDQPQHATGGAWRIICYRIVLGLVVFQLAMSGVLALKNALVAASLLIPLLIATLWYGYHFRERFEPLTRFISLRSIRRAEEPGGNAILDEDFGGAGGVHRELLRRGSTVDEDREKGLKFVNPSLISP
jgi:hypothetical protein